MFSIIVACDKNRAIGKDGDLPWRQSSDLKRFKQRTLGRPIVMGRKTWESLPGALPGRRNIVISRSSRDDVEVLSVEEVMALEDEEICITETRYLNRRPINCWQKGLRLIEQSPITLRRVGKSVRRIEKHF